MKISPEIEKLKAYVPGRAIADVQRETGLQSVIKLASNENPLGASAKAVAAIQNQLTEIDRYPEASSYDLLTALAEHLGVTTDRIAFGNGSNELIDLLIRVFCSFDDRIVISEMSFVAYAICAQSARVKSVTIPCTSDWRVDPAGFRLYFQKFADARDRVVFLPNPNNPTGSYLNAGELQDILDVVLADENRIVVLDEAYYEYVRAKDYPQTLQWQKKYPNLVIMRTFSKVYGLAGLRVGYIVAAPEIVSWINRVRNPFNINNLAQAAATAALRTSASPRSWFGVKWIDWPKNFGC